MNPIRGYTDGLAASYATATFLSLVRPPRPRPAAVPAAKREKAPRGTGLLRRLLPHDAANAAAGLGAASAAAGLVLALML